jgi:hypothetical protein
MAFFLTFYSLFVHIFSLFFFKSNPTSLILHPVKAPSSSSSISHHVFLFFELTDS